MDRKEQVSYIAEKVILLKPSCMAVVRNLAFVMGSTTGTKLLIFIIAENSNYSRSKARRYMKSPGTQP